MTYYLLKLTITSVLVVAVSELSRRSTIVGAVLASVPLVSVLAMIWLFIDTRDAGKVAALSTGIFWLVLPSLALFLVLPWMLRHGINFYLSLCTGIAVTALCYGLMVTLLTRLGVRL